MPSLVYNLQVKLKLLKLKALLNPRTTHNSIEVCKIIIGAH